MEKAEVNNGLKKRIISMSRYELDRLIEYAQEHTDVNSSKLYDKYRKEIAYRNLREYNNYKVRGYPVLMQLVEHAARKYGVSVDDLLSRNKRQWVVEARQYAMYLVYKRVKNLSAVGELFARNHATVIHSIKLISDRIEHNNLLPDYNEKLLNKYL